MKNPPHLLRAAMLAVLVGLAAPGAFAADAARVDADYVSRAWLAEDGLPENRVVGVVQAPDGYLWIATQGGVVRFDGVRFQPALPEAETELFAGTIRGILLDREGRVWVARLEGGMLISVSAGQLALVTANEGLPLNESQRSLAADGDGGIWVSYTSGKIIRYRAGKVERFGATEGVPSGGVGTLAAGRNGTLWLAKSGQLCAFNGERFVTRWQSGGAAVRVASARTGGVWFSAGPRLFRLAAGETNLPVPVAQLPGEEVADRAALEVTALHEDNAGALWIGTAAGGLFRSDRNGLARVAVSHPAILCLAEDREGNLWVGTRGGGLNRLTRRRLALTQAAHGLPFEAAQALCEDRSGALWVVGENGVLARRQAGEWRAVTPHRDLPGAYVTTVAADERAGVWIGTRGGSLYHWTDAGVTNLGARDALAARSVRCLLPARDGSVWIGTDGGDAVFRCEPATGRIQRLALKPGYRVIRALAEDAAGNIWVGGTDGLLARVTQGEVVNETALTGGLSVRTLHGTTNGDVWLGLAGSGVGRIRRGDYFRFHREHALPNDYVSQIISDGRGNLWFAGNQGMFEVAERSFDDVAAGRAARLQPVLHGRAEGLVGLQASFDYTPTVARTADDRLLFSMLTGVAEVRLDQARTNRHPPVVFVERVVADGQTAALRVGGRLATPTNPAAPLLLGTDLPPRPIRLGPGLNLVQFEFTALSFVAPENVRFRYQLEGLDADWVEAGAQRMADYTYPPPGRYRFRVVACNNDGLWNESGDALELIFAPHFWQTMWFRAAELVVAGGGLCAVVAVLLRRRHRRQIGELERQRALEAERSRIARDLHDDLGVGLTEIGLLGDLAGGAEELTAANRERVQEITGRARALVAALDEIVWAINPTNDSSQSLVDYIFPYAQRLLSRAGIRCRLQVQEPLPAGKLTSEQRHEFFHAYKEALNNVIRHSGATQVQVQLADAAGELVVRVTDNGRGFAGTTEGAPRHGLAGMRERLQRLGGRCEIQSAAGAGTTVTFVLPTQRERRP